MHMPRVLGVLGPHMPWVLGVLGPLWGVPTGSLFAKAPFAAKAMRTCAAATHVYIVIYCPFDLLYTE